MLQSLDQSLTADMLDTPLSHSLLYAWVALHHHSVVMNEQIDVCSDFFFVPPPNWSPRRELIQRAGVDPGSRQRVCVCLVYMNGVHRARRDGTDRVCRYVSRFPPGAKPPSNKVADGRECLVMGGSNVLKKARHHVTFDIILKRNRGNKQSRQTRRLRTPCAAQVDMKRNGHGIRVNANAASAANIP